MHIWKQCNSLRQQKAFRYLAVTEYWGKCCSVFSVNPRLFSACVPFKNSGQTLQQRCAGWKLPKLGTNANKNTNCQVWTKKLEERSRVFSPSLSIFDKEHFAVTLPCASDNGFKWQRCLSVFIRWNSKAPKEITWWAKLIQHHSQTKTELETNPATVLYLGSCVQSPVSPTLNTQQTYSVRLTWLCDTSRKQRRNLSRKKKHWKQSNILFILSTIFPRGKDIAWIYSKVKGLGCSRQLKKKKTHRRFPPSRFRQTLLLGVFENRHWVKCWPIEPNLVQF